MGGPHLGRRGITMPLQQPMLLLNRSATRCPLGYGQSLGWTRCPRIGAFPGMYGSCTGSHDRASGSAPQPCPPPEVRSAPGSLANRVQSHSGDRISRYGSCHIADEVVDGHEYCCHVLQAGSNLGGIRAPHPVRGPCGDGTVVHTGVPARCLLGAMLAGRAPASGTGPALSRPGAPVSQPDPDLAVAFTPKTPCLGPALP